MLSTHTSGPSPDLVTQRLSRGRGTRRGTLLTSLYELPTQQGGQALSEGSVPSLPGEGTTVPHKCSLQAVKNGTRRDADFYAG